MTTRLKGGDMFSGDSFVKTITTIAHQFQLLKIQKEFNSKQITKEEYLTKKEELLKSLSLKTGIPL